MAEQVDYNRKFDGSIYDKEYFEGSPDKTVGFDSYTNADGIIRDQYQFISRLMKPIASKQTALDVACAYGYSVDTLKEEGWDAKGFDISGWAVGQSKSDSVVIGNALESMTWQKYEDKEFGLIIANEFFEHIESKDVPMVIENMQRIGEWGLFVIKAHVSPRYNLEECDDESAHLNHHNISWWIKQFAEYGEIDFALMHEFNKFAEVYNKGVHWHCRTIILRFY